MKNKKNTSKTTIHELEAYASDFAEPFASSMMENFRSVGYSLPTAIADLIDNSITAKAKNIWLNFIWEGKDSFITILDDGMGMNKDELIDAMRPGKRNPFEERDPEDLGRFGLGLKTASFSQCRRLTVATKQNNRKIDYRAWDLDYVVETGKWQLLKYLSDYDVIAPLKEKASGTIVIWEQLDRIVKSTDKQNKEDIANFNQAAIDVKKHLAMVFHRFMEQGKIKIHFNGREIAPWDPYMKGVDATQALAEEKLPGSPILVKPYILPHHSKINEEMFGIGAGIYGWNAHQGFYIYRNERMLLAGDWLGLFKKEEHYKLCRIIIDLPNYLDEDWQIDIKKSVARPPAIYRGDLKRISSYARSRAQEVYRHRGKILRRKASAKEFHMVWFEKVKHGKRFYQINRDHPLVKQLICNSTDNSSLKDLLRLIEETVPVPLIVLRESQQPEMQGTPFESGKHDVVRELMKQVYENLIKSGRQPDQAKTIISNIEPFNYYPEYIELLQ